jgi:hypothetical protein
MSTLVAIMSMSLDGYVADPRDGVNELFDWYFNSGDVEIQTGGPDPMRFKVSEPSATHLRTHHVAPRTATGRARSAFDCRFNIPDWVLSPALGSVPSHRSCDTHPRVCRTSP